MCVFDDLHARAVTADLWLPYSQRAAAARPQRAPANNKHDNDAQNFRGKQKSREHLQPHLRGVRHWQAMPVGRKWDGFINFSDRRDGGAQLT